MRQVLELGRSKVKSKKELKLEMGRPTPYFKQFNNLKLNFSQNIFFNFNVYLDYGNFQNALRFFISFLVEKLQPFYFAANFHF